jgi:sugar fermentation stimulation protein A
MKYPDPLIRGRLLRRYKRFLADVELEDGTLVVAHCANPGSMMGLKEAGSEVWLSPSRNPARKLKYSLELVRAGDAPGKALVGVNTSLPNGIVEAAIAAGRVPELSGYDNLRREVAYGANSRIDILLESPGDKACYVEVKSVTLVRRAGLGEFPDAVTKRGTKHLTELVEMAASGHRAVMFFLVQRGDCTAVTTAADIDPVYDTAFRDALRRGVEILCYACNVSPEAIELGCRLPLRLSPGDESLGDQWDESP